MLNQPREQLIQVLQTSTDRKAKADACRELGVVGDKTAVPVLVGMLADPEMHHMARHALETIPGSAVDTALREQLGKLQGRQLVGVIGSLGVRRDAKAVKPLTGLLSHNEPDVAEAAARALGSIGGSSALNALQPTLSKASGRMQMAVAEGYLRAAESLKGRAAYSAYDKLIAMNNMPVHVRVAAMRGAIHTAGSGGPKLMQKALTDNQDVNFIAAIRAALEIKDKAMTKALTASLPSLQPAKQIVVVQTLGARKDEAALQTLSGLLKQADPAVQLAAVKAIGQIGAPESVRLLVASLTASDRQMATAARDALAGQTIPESKDAVIKLVRSSDPALQAMGVDLIGRRRMVTAMPELVSASRSSDRAVQSAAYRRIGELAGPAQVPDLLKAVTTAKSSAELEGPADALSRLASKPATKAEVTPQLVAAFDKANAEQKVALMPVMRSAGGNEPLAAVRKGLQDSEPRVRDAAIRTMADWSDTAAAADLLQVARSSNDASQKTLAFRGYLRLIRESELPPGQRLKMLDEAASVAQDSESRRLVLSAYGDISTVASLKKVAMDLNEPALADEAGAAAVRIAENLKGDQKAEAKPILEQVVAKAKSPGVVDKARKLLE